jgi:hypothetical protein
VICKISRGFVFVVIFFADVVVDESCGEQEATFNIFSFLFI